PRRSRTSVRSRPSRCSASTSFPRAARPRGPRPCPPARSHTQTRRLPMATVTTQLSGIEADVLRADDRRFDAMRKGDWAGLDAALADGLVYVHSPARPESTADDTPN